LAATAALVDVASESWSEGPLTDRIEAELAALDHLEVVRIGDNVIARTNLGRDRRLILAGHSDTVPANGNATARVDGDTLWGVGSADMKGGLAVMLESARVHRRPAVDVTYVFYAREEIAAEHNGLAEVVRERPDLLVADLALLGEPTDGAIEAGCQGAIRIRVTMAGARAHVARAWTGRNAIHRSGPLMVAIDGHVARRPVIDGCEYHEALQVVAIDGGVSGNVVPDQVQLTIAHRFAPDRSGPEAEAWLRTVVEPFLDEGDTLEVTDLSPAAPPGLDRPELASIVDHHRLKVRSKLGWTDVARFAELGVPAANFGPGDPTVAHTRDEHVTRDSIERCWAVIDQVVGTGT
jgi:succinyl-diaminopimelate desuccinylase